MQMSQQFFYRKARVPNGFYQHLSRQNPLMVVVPKPLNPLPFLIIAPKTVAGQNWNIQNCHQFFPSWCHWHIYIWKRMLLVFIPKTFLICEASIPWLELLTIATSVFLKVLNFEKWMSLYSHISNELNVASFLKEKITSVMVVTPDGIIMPVYTLDSKGRSV